MRLPEVRHLARLVTQSKLKWPRPGAVRIEALAASAEWP